MKGTRPSPSSNNVSPEAFFLDEETIRANNAPMRLKEFFPSLKNRRVLTYVCLGLMVVGYGVDIAESLRNPSSSQGITSNIAGLLKKMNPGNIIYPHSIEIQRVDSPYHYLKPNQNVPIVPKQFAHISFTLNYEKEATEGYRYSKDIRIARRSGNEEDFQIEYQGKGYFSILSHKEIKDAYFEIYNALGEKLGEFRSDFLYLQEEPNYEITFSKGGGLTTTVNKNDFLHIQPTIITSYVDILNANPNLSRVEGILGSLPSYKDIAGETIDEETFQKAFPSFAPEYEQAQDYTIDADNHLLFVSSSASEGTHQVKTKTGKTVSFNVTSEVSPSPSTLDVNISINGQALDPNKPFQAKENAILIEMNVPFLKPVLEGKDLGTTKIEFAREKPFQWKSDSSYYLYLPQNSGDVSLSFVSLQNPNLKSKTYTIQSKKAANESELSFQINGKEISNMEYRSDKLESVTLTLMHRKEDGSSEPYPFTYSFPSDLINAEQTSQTEVSLSFIEDGLSVLRISYDGKYSEIDLRVGNVTIWNSPDLLYRFARKILGHSLLHFCMALATAAFFFYYLSVTKARNYFPLYTLAVGIPTVFLSELFQTFAPGRGPGILDVGYNALGYAVGLALAMIIAILIRIRWNRKAEKMLAKGASFYEGEEMRYTGRVSKNALAFTEGDCSLP